MSAAERIAGALIAKFKLGKVNVVDDSAKHHGHAGAKPGGETHFSVKIVSSAFAGMSRIERHRKVYEALDAEFKDRLHALSLTALTPEEAEKK
jgi:BolA protein